MQRDENGLRGNYELPIRFETMIHPDYEAGKNGRTLYYGMHDSRFGKYLLAVTVRGEVIALEFTDDEQVSLDRLHGCWSQSNLVHGPELTGRIASRLFTPACPDPVPLLPRGTPFQLKVWERLIHIPFGETTTYLRIAEQLGIPQGAQAIGNAIGKNPIAYLIPCHRVVGKSGRITGYRWGRQRKRAILDWENSLAGKQRTLFQQPGS